MARLAKFTVLTAALVGALLGAPAAAASPENDFCRSMASIGFTDDCATLTRLARDACAQLDRGADLTAVADKVDVATKDQTLSNFIVAGAQLYFCPEPQPA